MEKILVSVIVPVLNTVKYVDECLSSIEQQSLKNLEILCVDGGSTDGTLEILQKYADKDARFHVITDTKRSYGKQVNRGIEIAIGDYIAIVEPDDYIAIDMYERLYEEVLRTNADIVRSNYMSFVGEGENRILFRRNIAKKEWYGIDVSAEKTPEVFDFGPANWSGIYRREFLINNSIWHNVTNGASFQDISFWFMSFAMAKKIRFIEPCGYYYRLDNPFSSVASGDKMDCIFGEFEYLERQLELKDLKKKYKSVVLSQKLTRFLWGFYRIEDKSKCTYLQKVSKELKRDMAQVELKCDEFDIYQRNEIEKLIYSYEEFLEEYEHGKKKIINLIKNSNGCILFGCGADGIDFLLLLKQLGLLGFIVAIIDNDVRLHGNKVLGIEIFPVEEIVGNYREAVYVVASKRYGKLMCEQLRNQGVKQEHILEERLI